MKREICVPTYEYLKFGNIFSGSLGDFNFKIFPILEEKKVKVAVWKGEFCFEKSEIIFCEHFSLEKGVSLKIKNLLEDKAKSYF